MFSKVMTYLFYGIMTVLMSWIAFCHAAHSNEAAAFEQAEIVSTLYAVEYLPIGTTIRFRADSNSTGTVTVANNTGFEPYACRLVHVSLYLARQTTRRLAYELCRIQGTWRTRQQGKTLLEGAVRRTTNLPNEACYRAEVSYVIRQRVDVTRTICRSGTSYELQH